MEKKIQPQDQVEKEILAAMESFGDKHQEVAEEGFPAGLKEWLNQNHTKLVKNPQTNDYESVPDKGEVNYALKKFASKLNEQLGIPCDKIDFDKYDLGSTQLDQFPKGGITFVENDSVVRNGMWGPFYFYDGRNTNVDKDARFSEGSLYRERDKKVVRIHRIPLFQLLSSAKRIWFIPEEDLVALGDTKKLGVERRKNREGMLKRKTTKELSKLSEWQRSDFDKSGYWIDRNSLEKRLTRYKASKRSGDLSKAIQKHLQNVEEFNQMTKEILDGASIIFHRAFEKEYSDYDKVLSDFLSRARSLKSALEQDSKKIEMYQKEIAETGSIDTSGDRYGYWADSSRGYLDLLKRINGGLRDGYWYGKNYYETYDRLIQIIDEFGPIGNGEGGED